MPLRVVLGVLATALVVQAARILSVLPPDFPAPDYVIIGGGLCGLVLANRLSVSHSVLVIEAGPDAQLDPTVNVPAQFVTLQATSAYSWNWPTVNQTVGGKQQIIHGGKVLGGSTAINGMIWSRGTKAQYDAIEALGNPGWNWRNLQKYMKKSENFYTPSATQLARGATYEDSAHGTGGPVGTAFFRPYVPFTLFKGFVKAAANLFGLEKGVDLCSGNPNSATQNIFSLHPTNTTLGPLNERSYAAEAYLHPIAPGSTHRGLTVLSGHQVTRIVWKPELDADGKKVAEGVEYAPGVLGVRRQVKARKEVIVSAGAIMTPHVLQLSGVGNPSILYRFNVPLAVNLSSVGTGLQDQPLTTFFFIFNPALATNADFTTLTDGPGEGAIAYPTIKQLLGSTDAAKAVQSLRARAQARAEKVVARGAWSSVEGLKEMYHKQADLIEINTPVVEFSMFFTPLSQGLLGGIMWLLLPQTRGSVQLASEDPFTYPRVDPAYLDDPFDLNIQTVAAQNVRKLFNSPSLSPFWVSELSPGELALPPNSTYAQYEQFVKSSYAPVYHPVGSCPMLPRAKGGCVSPKLKLYGTKNVRVVGMSSLL